MYYHNRVDRTGHVYGQLTVLRYVGKLRWECRCTCGVVKRFHINNLRTGETKSCGCLRRANGAVALTTHGKSKTAEFRSWASMKSRCSNPRDPSYANYGARGIGVCQRWAESFELFLSDMGSRPVGTTLDRVDNNKGYEPGNCRWSTLVTQAGNKRTNILLSIDGKVQCAKAWCREYAIGYTCLLRRLQAGWDPLEALTTPSLRGNTHGRRTTNTATGRPSS